MDTTSYRSRTYELELELENRKGAKGTVSGRVLNRPDPMFHGVHSSPITTSQLNTYTQKGYIMLPNMFSSEEIQNLVNETSAHKSLYMNHARI